MQTYTQYTLHTHVHTHTHTQTNKTKTKKTYPRLLGGLVQLLHGQILLLIKLHQNQVFQLSLIQPNTLVLGSFFGGSRGLQGALVILLFFYYYYYLFIFVVCTRESV